MFLAKRIAELPQRKWLASSVRPGWTVSPNPIWLPRWIHAPFAQGWRSR